MSDYKKILLIYTGGTIGMIKDPEEHALRPLDFENIYQHIPELRRLSCELHTYSFPEPKDSSNIQPGDWVELIKILQKNYTTYDGFVILHGTDTLAYTASALSFMIKNNQKPIVLTGSQLPIGVLRTDGKENLITAIEIASSYENGKAVVPEVSVYFEYKLFRGNRVKKVSAEHFKAFDSPNYPPLAEAGVHLQFHHSYIQKKSEGPVTFYSALNTQVGSVKLFPGISLDAMEQYLLHPAHRVVILETFGSGNAPILKALDDIFVTAIRQGKIILNVTQCMSGSVNQELYATGRHLKEIGILEGRDLTFEAAITKAMFLLQHFPDQVSTMLTQNIRGEMSE